ncbi:MAG: Ig-like domain-containing protein [Candidatus Riflebacteria bacterium]|nr:Ig-like domain-containing protein [Candidatus Riflebacteria bacterium]
MDSTTINTTNLTMTGPGGTPVSGTVTYSGLTANFTPAAALAFNSTYTFTITTGVKDLAGNPMAANYTWTFSTGAVPDTTPPTVASTDPASGAVSVAINKTLVSIFSESMDSTTINTTNFTVIGPGGTPVSGTVAYAGLTASFTPATNLALNATYTATIKTGVKDLAGNPMAANYTWTFMTGAAPSVTNTDPASGAANVAANKKISTTFSNAMDSTTINTTNYTLKGPGGVSASGTVTYDSVTKVATFTPTSLLALNATYTVTITTGVKDLLGNALAANYTWTFTTGAAPAVTNTDPASGAANVASNKKISTTFSNAMDSTTINTTNYTLTGPGGVSASGTVTYDAITKVATFTPTSLLTLGATYTVTITTGAKDLLGNALAANYTWTFTTGAAPTVTNTDPASGAANVASNKKISTTFSNAMDSTTINTTNYTLTGPGGVSASGTVTYDAVTKVATFTPTSLLALNATYTVTISTGAKDLIGNALAASFTWTFTTIAPPTATPTSPASGATDVALNQKIIASFSRDMDSTTISSLTFTVVGPGGTPVAGLVTYNTASRTATFIASPTNFIVSTIYFATIATGAKDLAGNALATNCTWKFTTGIRTLAAPVPLGTAAPYGGAGGSAGMTNQGTLTVVHGDILTTGAATLITGFHDSGGNVYTTTGSNDGLVTGLIYTATTPPGSTPGASATAADADARTAYTNLSPAALPGGIDVSAYGGGAGDLGNRTLLPGIYQSAPGSFKIQSGDLTLDGQGDPNAVWVFQMASSLTVGGPGAAFPQSVKLINGAQAKNVYWQVGSAATINAGGGGNMVGTIIAKAGAAFSTAGNVAIVTLDGRALGLDASVTLVNTVINVPQ